MNPLKRYGPMKVVQYAASEVYALLWKRPILRSYSQYGEDIIIDNLFHHKKSGFYVDIGAYDPNRFSNTMRFYQRGWNGITIEPDREHWKKFLRVRPRDLNLNIGIADKKGTLTYYLIDPPTLSTFSESQAQEYEKKGYRLVGKTNIRVRRLANVMNQFAKKKDIDLLSIDVEGFESEVLRSNDWKRFRPRVLCIEMTHSSSALSHHIKEFGYRVIEKTPDNYIYSDVRR